MLTDWFAPGYKAGGPIQSCVNMCRALQQDYDIFVLTSNTDHGAGEPYPGIAAEQWTGNLELGVQVYYLEKKKITTAKIRAVMLAVNADIVYLQLLFSPFFAVYPLWLVLTGVINNKVVVCPRGTLYESALSHKLYKKKPLLVVCRWLGIAKKVVFHATNDREKAAIQDHFPGSHVVVADNLPDMQQDAFESCSKVPGFLKCIFIARIVPIKNLLYLLQCLQKIPQTITLTIVGPVEDEQYWKTCKAVIEKLPSNITVLYAGAKNKKEIKALLKQQHLFILPTTGENFGHAIFEAMLAARPVLISDQTPWLQLEAAKAGWHYPLSQPELFIKKIMELAALDQEHYDSYANGAWEYAHSFISNPSLTAPYKILFE